MPYGEASLARQTGRLGSTCVRTLDLQDLRSKCVRDGSSLHEFWRRVFDKVETPLHTSEASEVRLEDVP